MVFLISAQVEIFVEVNCKISLDVRQYKKIFIIKIHQPSNSPYLTKKAITLV